MSIDGVTGARAVIRAASDRALARAWLELSADAPARGSAALASLGAVHPLDALARAADGLAIVNAAKATIQSDGQNFDLTCVPPVSGRYVLVFEDSTGLAGRREFDVRLSPDPSPLVHLERPSAGRESLSVLPNAKITLTARITDELFAVRSVWLEYRTSSTAEWNRLSLAEPPMGSPKKQLIQIDQPFDLKSVRHPDGALLRDGDTLTLVTRGRRFRRCDHHQTTRSQPRSGIANRRRRCTSCRSAESRKPKFSTNCRLCTTCKISLGSKRMRRIKSGHKRVFLSPKMSNGSFNRSKCNSKSVLASVAISEGLRGAVERLRETLRDNVAERLGCRARRADGLAAELRDYSMTNWNRSSLCSLPLAPSGDRVPANERGRGPLPQATRLQQDAERTLRELSERMTKLVGRRRTAR